MSIEFQPISNTLLQGAVSLQPQDAQCSSPPPLHNHTPSLIPHQIWAACIKQAPGRTGTLQQRGWQVSRMFKSGRKPATARPPQVLLTPTNCLLHSRRKNAAPLPPAKPRNVCCKRRLPPIPPPAPAGEPALYPGKGNGSDYYTHYPTAPRLLKKNKSLFCARNKRRYLN